MKPRMIPALVGLATAAAMVTVGPAAGATTAGGHAPGTRAGPAAVRALLAKDAGNTQRPSAKVVRAMVGYKTRHSAQAAWFLKGVAASAAHNALKAAMIRNGAVHLGGTGSARAVRESVTSGPGYAYVDYMRQQGQQTGYWCGPATVSEIAWTVPGPSNVNQATAASYMGTTTDGTTDGAMVSGLNHFVGEPDFGWDWYWFTGMDYNPTGAQRAAFLSNLQTDVYYNTPLAGNAWEVPGGPHLVGEPANEQIFHYIEIGGWDTDTSQVYYADSATTVWNTVPPYSWFDTYTMETILGGMGYIW
jgi:hypothetical protein